MKKELIVIGSPKSPEAEMFKNLRTNIQFMNADSPKKVMLITSTVPGEGKSYVFNIRIFLKIISGKGFDIAFWNKRGI